MRLEYGIVRLPSSTINFLNIRTPKKFVVITLKFELCGSTNRVMSPNGTDGMANSVDPDLGLHCLPRPVCPKT